MAPDRRRSRGGKRGKASQSTIATASWRRSHALCQRARSWMWGRAARAAPFRARGDAHFGREKSFRGEDGESVPDGIVAEGHIFLEGDERDEGDEGWMEVRVDRAGVVPGTRMAGRARTVRTARTVMKTMGGDSFHCPGIPGCPARYLMSARRVPGKRTGNRHPKSCRSWNSPVPDHPAGHPALILFIRVHLC